MALQYASLEMEMVHNEQKYSGPEWEEYWRYAKEAVGFAQQQLADHQLFNFTFGTRGTNSGEDYHLAKTYKYITETRDDYDRFDSVAAGVVLPQTDFDYYSENEIAELGVNPADYEQFAWADVDNMFISLRDGDFRMFGNLNELNKGYSSNGRLHVLGENYDHIVQIATDGKYQYQDYWIRMDNIDMIFFEDQLTNRATAPQAMAGEIIPITYQPGVGKTDRDNFEADTPYAGYPDLLTARYGQYFIVFNTTRGVYGNEQSFDVTIPSDYKEKTVLDLVSGKQLPVSPKGKVTIPPKTAMVLKLTTGFDGEKGPDIVDFTSALAGNDYAGITWKTTPGAQSYEITRSETENGKYKVIAKGVKGNYFKDTKAKNGNVYYYKVYAENRNGKGDESYRAKVDLTVPVSGLKKTEWRDDRIGTTAGSAAVSGSSITIAGANGRGLGEGDDLIIYDRDIRDSLHFVNQAAAGSSVVSAKLDSWNGSASGIMMRDRLQENTRYIYFGADQDGNLVLQNRTRDSRHAFSEQKKSPMNALLLGLRAEDYPYIKLVRDYDSHYIHAYVSKDGANWQMVKRMFTPFPYAVYAGVAAAKDASFSDVTVEDTPNGQVYPYVKRSGDSISLTWNKPKQAVKFSVFRTDAAEAALSDPVFKSGTLELEDGSPWTVLASETPLLSYEDDGPGFEDFPVYKIAAISADGTVLGFTGPVYPPNESPAPHVTSIKVANRAVGQDDTIEVSGLPEGTIVKVYRTPTDLAVMGSTVTGSAKGTVSIPQIGAESGVLYVSAAIPGKMESARTAKSYPGENGLINLKVEKDATLRFNTSAPGDFKELTILSNGTEEGNKRFGIVTFNNVPDFGDDTIESVTLKMYRANARTALLRAHHIEWDDWKEPGSGGTLGAELKAGYFGGSSNAALAFFGGPNASATVTPENGNAAYGINGSWYLDVTEIAKANQGTRATFLLSVPSGEVNPLTKEYISGSSAPGQFAAELIVKYKTDNT